MGEVVPIGGSVESSETNVALGQALFAAIVDELAATGVTVPRRLIATAAKQGREALDDGVAPDVVLAGCLAALRSGKPQYTTHLIGDLAFAKAGQYLTPADYRKRLSETNLESNPALLRITETMDRINLEKQQRRER